MSDVQPVPQEIANDIRSVTNGIADDDMAYRIARLAERAYADGYRAGHVRATVDEASRRYNAERCAREAL